MAITYAAKYDPKVVERFKLKSLTEAAINRDYEWSGVSTINAYSYPTTALSDYTLTGAARYGTASEQQNTVQTMTVAKDRSATITVDKKTLDDTSMTAVAGKILSRQIDEVLIPEIDLYRLSALGTAATANSGSATAAVTASNAYVKFLAGQEWLGNKKVPSTGRIAFCSYAYYNFLKQDTSFMLASECMANERINGMVGMVDGVKIVPCPSSILPTNVAFIITHPSVTVGVTKLEDYNIYDKVPGISGVQIDMRCRYDAFVLTAKKDGIWQHLIA